jgi:hypothetical protein
MLRCSVFATYTQFRYVPKFKHSPVWSRVTFSSPVRRSIAGRCAKIRTAKREIADCGVRLPRKQSAHIADKKFQRFGPRTVARMSHVLQIVSAVHNCPAAQLIFAHLTGMFMVNVVARGRSYRNNVIAVLASFPGGFGALQQRVRGGACVGQCGCASKKLGAARHVIARAGLRSRIRSCFVIGRVRRRPGLLACSRADSYRIQGTEGLQARHAAR